MEQVILMYVVDKFLVVVYTKLSALFGFKEKCFGRCSCSQDRASFYNDGYFEDRHRANHSMKRLGRMGVMRECSSHPLITQQLVVLLLNERSACRAAIVLIALEPCETCFFCPIPLEIALFTC